MIQLRQKLQTQERRKTSDQKQIHMYALLHNISNSILHNTKLQVQCTYMELEMPGHVRWWEVP